ncbi:MAG: hypothetical protein JWP84_888 [Tardiphaga sp.]|jgi:hypothetical protein|nr:hypothetical protein [Tardiphaga sp.]
MGSLIAPASSSCKPSDPSIHFTATSGPAAIAAISAFDFGGVAVPHRISVGAGKASVNPGNSADPAMGRARRS